MMNRYAGLAMLVAVLSVGTARGADVFDVDKAHSFINFSAKHMVVSSTKGGFGEYTAEFSVDPADPTTLSATATIEAKSINTDNVKRDDHLRSPDFFDVATYPQVKFVSTGVEKSGDDYILKGNLSMKDVTKEIAIPVSVSGPVTDPWGNTRFGFEGATKINRKDWNINFSGTLDNGGLIVSDEVKIEISIEGILRK